MPVSVPATSANLGPGFDVLGMAVELRAVIGTEDEAPAERAEFVSAGHPAAVAFHAAGGRGSLWVRSPIPAGRGLGFSGAMRVGGVVAAWAQRGGTGAELDDARRGELMAIPSALEGHPDNAAPSMFGGITVATGDVVLRVATPLQPSVVVWVPDEATTSTDHSRATLATQVALADAASNIGRTALLVAALSGGRFDLLRQATVDRLHQDQRLEASPLSHAAYHAWMDAPTWAVWLSGSGPSVAAWCDPADTDAVVAAAAPGGHVKVLAIAERGAQLL